MTEGVERALSLTVISTTFAITRLEPSEPVPSWAAASRTFLSISRTPSELSIVADEAAVPTEMQAARGYRALRVEGPLPLELVGVVASLAAPLADARIPIFPIATYDTDYILVHERDLERAVDVLARAGHRVLRGGDAP